jgi:hypothetical protein
MNDNEQTQTKKNKTELNWIGLFFKILVDYKKPVNTHSSMKY